MKIKTVWHWKELCKFAGVWFASIVIAMATTIYVVRSAGLSRSDGATIGLALGVLATLAALVVATAKDWDLYHFKR